MPVRGQGFRPTLASVIAAVGTTFNVFSYEAVWALELNPSPPQRRANVLTITPQMHIQTYNWTD